MALSPEILKRKSESGQSGAMVTFKGEADKLDKIGFANALEAHPLIFNLQTDEREDEMLDEQVYSCCNAQWLWIIVTIECCGSRASGDLVFESSVFFVW